MTSREQFLRYCKDNGLLPGTVLTEIWQAAERQALERAAALIEPKNDMDDWTDWARTLSGAAQQIRGLKEQKQ